MQNRSLILFFLLAVLASSANAQNQENDVVSDDVFYQHLALAMRSLGPGSCANDSPPGFSTVAPCSTIAGVDPARAEFFAIDFLQYAKLLDSRLTDGVCGAAGDNLTINEVESRLAANKASLREQKLEYFLQRGEEILGPTEFQTLLAWGEENLRPGIRGYGAGLGDLGFADQVGGDTPADGLRALICNGN